ncbi:hypothetical protein ACFV90_11545 [Streptomyces sp. NPDC059904]|uniref:hypothetical protein n=1 Tax=Streptomyces sp. NPDC059904 TaxID=3346996 RepID=UPI00365373DE
MFLEEGAHRVDGGVGAAAGGVRFDRAAGDPPLPAETVGERVRDSMCGREGAQETAPDVAEDLARPRDAVRGGLLTAYWALSGYGLRASRALGWLAAAMLVTIMLLMGVGLPQDAPKQKATGTVPADGGTVTFEVDKDDPRNLTGNRFSSERFEKALNVMLNSVVFRSADQDLTTAGTDIEMTSRLAEPVLLGLAVLAVRNRVKRCPTGIRRNRCTRTSPAVSAGSDVRLCGIAFVSSRRGSRTTQGRCLVLASIHSSHQRLCSSAAAVAGGI